MAKSGPKTRPVRDRIMASVVVDVDTGCWNWQKSRNELGYGRIGIGSRTDGTRGVGHAHRVSYETFVGPIPEGLHIDHLCRNPSCVNPEHLEPVTVWVNVIERGQGPVARQSRQTHCKRGHPFDEENTYHNRGKRYCRACVRNANRERYQRQKALTAEG